MTQSVHRKHCSQFTELLPGSTLTSLDRAQGSFLLFNTTLAKSCQSKFSIVSQGLHLQMESAQLTWKQHLKE